jgi:hypothetical protein
MLIRKGAGCEQGVEPSGSRWCLLLLLLLLLLPELCEPSDVVPYQ